MGLNCFNCQFCSVLFPDVIKNMQTPDLELKKLCYLYLMNYAKSQPDVAIMCISTLTKVSQLFACWVIFMLLLLSADFFSKLTFSKNSFRNIICVSKGLNPDWDRLCVHPDLGPN